jgi:hypothetical protein
MAAGPAAITCSAGVCDKVSILKISSAHTERTPYNLLIL